MCKKLHDKHSQVISVVIRVRNAADDLFRCLSRLKTQIPPLDKGLEIIVVDNESTDKTVEVARSYGAIVVSILRKDFSWGRALNMGIAKASGNIVLLLSADAYPANNIWVWEMTRYFEEPNVAIVFGRQLPRNDAPVDERVRLEKMFRTEPEYFDRVKHRNNVTGKEMIASNTCAAIRRSLWQQQPYDEKTSGGEEGPFICYALNHGLSVIYHPAAQVYHSHRESAFRLACRELEILDKNLSYRGKKVTAADKIRLPACLVKRRLKNCIRPNIPLKFRLEGLIRLPLEIAAIALVACCSNNGSLNGKQRYFFWG